jgi:hypothetical protein
VFEERLVVSSCGGRWFHGKNGLLEVLVNALFDEISFGNFESFLLEGVVRLEELLGGTDSFFDLPLALGFGGVVVDEEVSAEEEEGDCAGDDPEIFILEEVVVEGVHCVTLILAVVVELVNLLRVWS